MKTKLIFLFLFAFLIRLIGLNQSLWLDEATTAKVVQSFSYLGILTKFSPGDFHPPLYYFVMKFWTTLFGYSEILLRIPSVIFSLLCGWIIYQIGKVLKNEKVGFWSAVFFLFNPLIVYYSREVRMYTMTVFLLAVATYYFILVIRNSNCIINLVLFSLFCGLSFLTFYGSAFYIAALLLLLLYKKQYKPFSVSCILFAFFLLIVAPLLLRQHASSRNALGTVINWKQVLGPASLKNLILIPLKFAFGRISFYPKQLYYLIAGIWTCIVFLFVMRGSRKNKELIFLFTIPLFIGLLFSFFSPLLQYFRFIYLIIPMSIMLALGARKTKVKIILVSGFLFLSLIYLINPSFHREDWKSLTYDLKSKTPVYMIISSSDPVLYYRPDISVKDLVQTDKKISDKNIIVIPYTSDIHGVDYQKNLTKQSYSLIEKKAYRELYVEYWIRSVRVD